MTRLHCPSPYADAIAAEIAVAEKLAVAYVAQKFCITATEVREIVQAVRAHDERSNQIGSYL